MLRRCRSRALRTSRSPSHRPSNLPPAAPPPPCIPRPIIPPPAVNDRGSLPSPSALLRASSPRRPVPCPGAAPVRCRPVGCAGAFVPPSLFRFSSVLPAALAFRSAASLAVRAPLSGVASYHPADLRPCPPSRSIAARPCAAPRGLAARVVAPLRHSPAAALLPSPALSSSSVLPPGARFDSRAAPLACAPSAYAVPRERQDGRHALLAADPARHQATIASANSLARSSGPAGRGASFVTRCCGSVPSTRAGMSAAE